MLKMASLREGDVVCAEIAPPWPTNLSKDPEVRLFVCRTDSGTPRWTPRTTLSFLSLRWVHGEWVELHRSLRVWPRFEFPTVVEIETVVEGDDAKRAALYEGYPSLAEIILRPIVDKLRV